MIDIRICTDNTFVPDGGAFHQTGAARQPDVLPDEDALRSIYSFKCVDLKNGVVIGGLDHHHPREHVVFADLDGGAKLVCCQNGTIDRGPITDPDRAAIAVKKDLRAF